MADETIRVVQGSSPVETLTLKDFRNQADPEVLADVSAKTFKLIVKRSIEDADNQAFFDLTATLPGGDGEYRFTFTAEHTSRVPNIYPGEIRIFNTLTPSAGQAPDDIRTVEFIIDARVRRQEL